MSKKQAEQIANLSERYDTATRKLWLEKQQEGYDFRMGDQLSKDQKEKIRASGMPDFVIDMISPQIRMIKYFITANNPRWNAVGVDGSDIDIAHVFSAMIDYMWYTSKGKLEFSKIIDNTLSRSIGYFHFYEDPDMDQGMGEVVFESLQPKNVKIDPESTDLLFRDAGGIMIEYEMARYQLMNKLPKYRTKIKKAQSTGAFSFPAYSGRDLGESSTVQKEDYQEPIDPETGEDSDMVRFRRYYKKIRSPFVKVFVKIPPGEAEIKEIQKVVDMRMKEVQAEISVQVLEQEAALQASLEAGEIIQERFDLELENAKKKASAAIEQEVERIRSRLVDEKSVITIHVVPEKEYEILIKNKKIKDNIVYEKKYSETRIKIEVTVDDQFLYEDILNISEYPVIPLPFEHTGTPYPASAVDPLKGKAQEITKAHQIAIHHANVSSNSIWLAPKGLIENKQTWEQYASSAAAVLEYNDDGSGRKPERSFPLPINNAFYTILQEAKGDLEYSAMVNSSMMGDATKQPEPFRGMLANDEFGTRQIKSWVDNVLNPVLEHVGLVFQQMSQNFYTFNKIFRIVQPNTVGDLEVKEVEINNPIYSDFKNAIGKYNDYASAKFDVRLIAGSTMPVNRWALLNEYERWAEKGLIPPGAFLAETDLPNKEKLIEKMDRERQLERENEALQEEVKQKDGDIDTLKRQNIQKDMKVRVAAMETELRKSLVDQKGHSEVEKKKLTIGVNQAINELNDEVSEKTEKKEE